MSSGWTAPTRRSLLAASAVGGARGAGLFASNAAHADPAIGAGASGLRPFQVSALFTSDVRAAFRSLRQA